MREFWPSGVLKDALRMSIEDTIGFQHDTPECVVCGKNVQGDRGFARISHKGIMVNVCCPHCLETFQNDPATYMARLSKNELYQALKEIGGQR